MIGTKVAGFVEVPARKGAERGGAGAVPPRVGPVFAGPVVLGGGLVPDEPELAAGPVVEAGKGVLTHRLSLLLADGMRVRQRPEAVRCRVEPKADRRVRRMSWRGRRNVRLLRDIWCMTLSIGVSRFHEVCGGVSDRFAERKECLGYSAAV